MEMVSVGNESISNSINKYNNDKQDFAVYAYVNVLNDLRSYFQSYGSVVKSSIVKGKRQYASVKDMDGIDFSDKTEEDKGKPDYVFIYSILKEEKNPIKPHVWEIFCYTYGFCDDFPKTNVEAAEKFGFTSNNIRVINLRVRERMKNNEKIIKYLSSFL